MGFGFGLYLLSADGIVILLVVLRLVGRFVLEHHGPAGSKEPDGVASPDDSLDGGIDGRRGTQAGG